jgi:hypothetical protein
MSQDQGSMSLPRQPQLLSVTFESESPEVEK